MTLRPHYKNAPIAEAVIQLRVGNTTPADVKGLRRMADAVATDYPKCETILANEFHIQVGDVSSASASQQEDGVKLHHIDNRYVCQAQRDSFSLSALPPYDSWEPFRDEARRLWHEYKPVVPTDQIWRIAVRYINRLIIPHEGTPIEPSDYLNTYVQVATDYLHSDIQGFFAQLKIPQPDLQGILILNEARAEPPDSSSECIILDLDLFSQRRESPWPSQDEDAVWSFLEELHVRKNEIFEASITDKMRGLIQ